jgi:hypothetical protein
MSRGSELLRGLADQHYALAIQADGRREWATAEAFRRTWKLMRDAAIEMELKQVETVAKTDVFAGFRGEEK